MTNSPTQAEIAEVLLTSPDTPRDVSTEWVVRKIEKLEAVVNAAKTFRHAEIRAGAIRLGLRSGNQDKADDTVVDALGELRVSIDLYCRDRRTAAEPACRADSAGLAMDLVTRKGEKR